MKTTIRIGLYVPSVRVFFFRPPAYKEETVLQGMIDNLIEIGSCYGMEMNVEKTKVMRISRHPSPVTFMIDQKQLENVECFKYLGSMLTNDGRCTR